jgi:hypothetical protein
MKTLWLTILSAIVIALASLYLASRPKLDRSLLVDAPPAVNSEAAVARPDEDVQSSNATAPQAVGQTEPIAPKAEPGEDAARSSARSSADRGRATPLVVVAATATSSSPLTPPSESGAGNDATRVDPQPDRVAPRPATVPTSPPPLPRAERPSLPTGRLAALETTEPSAAERQTAQCRALAAYLRDLQARAGRAADAGEAAMIVDQRRITYARQVELGCAS